MAQWSGQFSGFTHETKVQDVEASLRQAILSFNTAPKAERENKSKAVHHLSERLVAVRLKALRARLSALRKSTFRKTGQKGSANLENLQARQQEIQTQGAAGILKEFNFQEKTVA